MDMPLNAALIVSGDYEPGSIAVVNSRDERVDVTIDQRPPSAGICGGTSAEIIPRQPWAPHETYTVRAQSTFEESTLSVSFVTGDEMMPERPRDPPAVHLSTMTGFPYDGGCGTPAAVRSCVQVEDQAETDLLEVIARRGDAVVLRVMVPKYDDAWELAFAELPDCIEFRHRFPTGERSEPRTVCGKESLGVEPRIEIHDPNTHLSCEEGAYVTHMTDTGPKKATGFRFRAPPASSDARPRDHDDGCTALPDVPSGDTTWIGLLLAAFALVLRRRATPTIAARSDSA